MIKLGKIKEVPIRNIWNHEQYDFSAWLALEENLSILGDELGLSLIEPETEKPVGIYRSDIVCKDEATNKVVLIENQLEPTNHDHLGKIITYASGLNAKIIIWIVEKAKEEHASAIEWLNEYIDSDISFFLLEIHAIQIDDSKPAPSFEIIEQPNDFNINVKKISNDGKNSERDSKILEWWTKFNEVIQNKNAPFNKRKESTDHWCYYGLGSSKCQLSCELRSKSKNIRLAVLIPDCPEQYDKFLDNKDEIESQVNESLLWEELSSRKSSRISVTLENFDLNDSSNHDELREKCVDILSQLKKSFSRYLLK